MGEPNKRDRMPTPEASEASCKLTYLRTFGSIQFPGYFLVRRFEFLQESWVNGEQIAARQLRYLRCVAEGGAHHYSLVAVLLVVVVDLSHANHAYVQQRNNIIDRD